MGIIDDAKLTARVRFAAIGVILVGALAGCGVTAPPEDEETLTPEPVAAAPVPNGWIAYFTYGPEEDIYFVKEGSAPHPVLESDGAAHGQVCPAFSPDGTRLASGDGGYGQQVPKQGALVISDLTEEGEVAASEVFEFDGLLQQPCPIWSPDGKWVAFGVGSTNSAHTWAYYATRQVWAVDAQTGEERRLPAVSATDIEWSTDSSELYIAATDGIEVYSIAEDFSLLDDTEGAVALSASPDGDSLAVQRRRNGPVGLSDHFELLHMSVAGEDRRVLVEDYAHNLGIGPVWSPDGKRIVFHGGEGAPLVFSAGESFTDGEKDEVVVLIVGEDDPLGPAGTQVVLAPIQTTEGDTIRHWLPSAASWSPDGAALRVIGWELGPSHYAESSAMLVVPVDGTAPSILWEGPARGPATSVPQNDFQGWGR